MAKKPIITSKQSKIAKTSIITLKILFIIFLDFITKNKLMNGTATIKNANHNWSLEFTTAAITIRLAKLTKLNKTQIIV